MGGFAEVLAIPATLALLLVTPIGSTAFPLTALAFAAAVAAHAAYWVLTHPVNKFWLQGQELGALGKGYFAFAPIKRAQREGEDGDDLWKRYRDRWEYSHVLRALLSFVAFLALAVAVVL